MKEFLKIYWHSFTYNFGWSDYVKLIDGWIPKLALTVPIIGYLILFNDKISQILIFKEIAKEDVISFGLTGLQRLRFLYFGLLLLGLANVIYLWKKPYQFRFGTNVIDYVKNSLEIFTYYEYLQIHETIRREGHKTGYGKYYDSEWEGFVNASRNTGEGTENVLNNGHWEEAKRKYGSLIRSILMENFFRNDKTGKIWLAACVTLSLIGYLLLLIPSFDLFLKICRSIFIGST